MSDVNTIEAPDATRHQLGYDGRGGDIAKIALWNGFLTIITLGIFRFWAKTRMRRYVWSRFSLDGDRVEYTGTGGELFRGFLVAFLLFLAFVIPIRIIIAMLGAGSPVAIALSFGYFAVVLLLICLAGFFAHRYRLTRTRWRGIRGGMRAKILPYMGIVIGYGLLTVLTAGITYPLGSLARKRYLWNHSRFGTAAISCEAKVGRAWLPWLLQYGVWVAFLVLAGVVFAIAGAGAKASGFNPQDVQNPLLFLAAFSGYLIVMGIGYLLTIAISTGCLVAYYLRELRQILNGMAVAGVKVTSTLRARTMLWRIIAIAVIQSVMGAAAIGILIVAGLMEVGMGGDPSAGGIISGILLYLVITILSVILVAVLWTNPLYRTIAGTTAFVGAIDMAAIGQNTDTAPTRGEGLMELFSIDA